VIVRAASINAEGMVLNRIARGVDVWGEIHIPDARQCEALLQKHYLTIEAAAGPGSAIVGAVDASSSDTRLEFFATRQLETGQAVQVRTGGTDILYQLRYAEIQRSTVKGGAQLIVRAIASQLGVFDAATHRIARFKWVPAPGAAVSLPPADAHAAQGALPPAWLQLGTLIGTTVPLYLDTTAATEGHLAILGMTRMGKTTFALKLATLLSASRGVTILDQTGEYMAKRGLPAYAGAADDHRAGLWVLEPQIGNHPANAALQHLQHLIDLAQQEYQVGNPLPRVLVLDEAHQFVPEPALMGFNAPGRESAIQFGQLIMQVRKLGICVVLISQRTAVVAKSALSQCENLIAFKSVDQTGLDYLEAVIGSEARKALPSLAQGQALVFGPAVSSDLAAVVAVSP
jgi:hypothetical protein